MAKSQLFIHQKPIISGHFLVGQGGLYIEAANPPFFSSYVRVAWLMVVELIFSL